ncbi:MAG: hypothetical protein ACMX3H_16535 [Sodalis sp. (in: enterobacteria)]
MEHILTGPYNKPTNNSRRPPRGAYGYRAVNGGKCAILSPTIFASPCESG